MKPYSDEVFERELKLGHKFAEIVADRFRAAGLSAEVTPYEFRESYGARHRFRDEFDLLVESRRIEVKSRGTVRFTSPADFPKPTAFVYSERGWKAKRHKPAAIVLVCQETIGLAVVPVSSSPHWKAREIGDSVKGHRYKVLEVPREHLRTIEHLVAWLRPAPVHEPAPALITADMINWSYGEL